MFHFVLFSFLLFSHSFSLTVPVSVDYDTEFSIASTPVDLLIGNNLKNVVDRFGLAEGGVVTIDLDISVDYGAAAVVILDDDARLLAAQSAPKDQVSFLEEEELLDRELEALEADLDKLPDDEKSEGRFIGSMKAVVLVLNSYEVNMFVQYARESGSGLACDSLPSTLRLAVPLKRQGESGSVKASAQITVRLEDRYSVFVGLCEIGTARIAAEGTVSLVNPNGQELSLELIPVVYIYIILMFAYSCLLIVSSSQLRTSLSHMSRKSVALLFFICVLSKFIEVAIGLNSFQLVQKSKYESKTVEGAEMVMNVISNGFLLSFVLVSTTGWDSMGPRIGKKELKTVAPAFIFYVVFGNMFEFCNSTTVCIGFGLTFGVIRFLILFMIFLGMKVTFTILRRETHLAIGNLSHQFITHLSLKRFHAFFTIYLFWIVFQAAILFVEVSLLRWKDRWIRSALIHTVSLGMYTGMCLTTTPPTHPYEALLQNEDRDMASMAALNERERERTGERETPAVPAVPERPPVSEEREREGAGQRERQEEGERGRESQGGGEGEERRDGVLRDVDEREDERERTVVERERREESANAPHEVQTLINSVPGNDSDNIVNI